MTRNHNEKVIVIGGGIAGLSAGIYALLAGFQVEIYEKNRIPGGECIGSFPWELPSKCLFGWRKNLRNSAERYVIIKG